MKRLLYSFLSLICITCSCINQELSEPDSDNLSIPNNTSSFIDRDEAVTISAIVLNRLTQTRGNYFRTPDVTSVVDKNLTRSNLASDTVAYIVNYPDDKGFVIISSDRRVYPVLGFSTSGNLDMDNDAVRNNFIDKIGYYINNNTSDKEYEVNDSDFDGCYAESPKAPTSIDQGTPWNKYVVIEHPLRNAGCVPVATALVMMHTKAELKYHGSVFHFNAMAKALNTKTSSSSKNAPQRIVGGYMPVQPEYTYLQAVDSVAKLLYWIGKDIGVDYDHGSGAPIKSGYVLCDSLGFLPTAFKRFDVNEVTWYIKDGHIAYLRGTDMDGAGGHAWVSDGCYFCVDDKDKTQITQTFLHCNWGWGGSGNGYYSGEVFEVEQYGFKMKPLHYFTVKRAGNTIKL